MSTITMSPVADAAVRVPHPVVRATCMSSAIGLLAGLVLGLITQAREHDAG